MLIGLGYKARSGKDTVADILVRDHYFKKVAFAGALKEACEDVFQLTPEQLHGDAKEKVDPFWKVTPREILQHVGTECFRKGYGEDIWVRALYRRIESTLELKLNTVVTDVRFPNEAQAIHEWGGLLVRVDRMEAKASGGIQNHASEVSMDFWKAWDVVLNNDRTLDDLEKAVHGLMAGIEAKR